MDFQTRVTVVGLPHRKRLFLVPLLACLVVALAIGHGRSALAAEAGDGQYGKKVVKDKSGEQTAGKKKPAKQQAKARKGGGHQRGRQAPGHTPGKGQPVPPQPGQQSEKASSGDAAQVELVNLTYVSSHVKPTGNPPAAAPATPALDPKAKKTPDGGAQEDPQTAPAPRAPAPAGAESSPDSIQELVDALNEMFPRSQGNKSPGAGAPSQHASTDIRTARSQADQASAETAAALQAGSDSADPSTQDGPAPPQGGGKTGNPGDKSPPVVKRLSHGHLLLRGTPQERGDIRQILDQTDVPWPQVQFDMWAVQVSGKADEVSDELHRIAKLIAGTRDELVSVQRRLARLASNPVETDRSNFCFKNLEDLQKKIDFPLTEPLSLNESLILLLLSEDRTIKIKALQDSVDDRWKRLRSRACACPGQEKPGRPECAVDQGSGTDHPVPFRRLAEALAVATDQMTREEKAAFDKTHQGYCNSLEDFFTAYIKVRDDRNAMYASAPKEREFQDERSHAAELKRRGGRIDRLLKSLLDAFIADVDEMYFYPLLDDIREATECNRRNNGVTLTGRTHMVVTSGMESDLDPEMASFVETTRPKPFGKDLLDLAFANDTTSGTGKFLATLPQGKAALLAGALLSEPAPSYSKIAPGIAVHVLPTVLPDGSAARLTIDARFGVTTADYDPQNQGRGDLELQPPPPGISSHHVVTDAAVSAFDLFGISSFTFDTSVPQAPFVIPILGRLPIIGRAFQFRRDNVTTRHESIILVNTAIVPRSLVLMQYYDKGLPSKQPQPAKPQAVAARTTASSPN